MDIQAEPENYKGPLSMAVPIYREGGKNNKSDRKGFIKHINQAPTKAWKIYSELFYK